MSAMQQPFTPTERMIVARRQQLLEAAVEYVRHGRDGTMRDRLRTASNASGIPVPHLETEVGNVERLRANYEDKSPVVETVKIEENKP